MPTAVKLQEPSQASTCTRLCRLAAYVAKLFWKQQGRAKAPTWLAEIGGQLCCLRMRQLDIVMST